MIDVILCIANIENIIYMKTILILLITLVLSSCKKEVPEPNFPIEKLRDLNDHINTLKVDTIKY